MSTELLNLTKESSLEFADCAYFINREKTNLSTNGIKLTLELVKNNGEVISQIKDISYNKKDTTDIKTYFKIDCSKLQSGQYFIRVSGNINEQVKYDISDCLDIEYESVNKNNFENVELNIEELPKQYSLSQNYPNPFNPLTTINYQLPKDGHVTLKIYDMLGKEVITLVNEFKTSGKYNIKFDGSNLSSGVYFYKIEAGNFSDTKKLILMK
ncbi:MAG: T9SS type A sorting domain-containing protein [Ignavibacteriae bacterium]|nr:T9SS type A sorting domain-containing protein [Ignavibacteriota bacterium]